MDQFTKNLTKTLLSNGDVKELFRQQLETAINHNLQAELTALLGYDPYDRSGFNTGNSRNGQCRVTVKAIFITTCFQPILVVRTL